MINQIEAVYAELVEDHGNNLDRYGVKLPPLLKHDGNYNARALQLVFLKMNFRTLVKRDDIANFVKIHAPNASNDQQPRHLKYDGWDVRLSGKARDIWIDGKPVQNGFNGLASVENPSINFMAQRIKRVARLNPKDWDDLVKSYDNKCAVCGDSSAILEKGHKNPIASDSLSNLIPMCGKCNNWASNDVILDEEGRVCGLATPKLVMSSPEEVRYEIFKQLGRMYKK